MADNTTAPKIEWDSEIATGTADSTGETIAWNGTFSGAVGVMISNVESSGGSLLVGVNIALGDLTQSLRTVLIAPGECYSLPVNPEAQLIRVKGLGADVDYCAQRFRWQR